jgi:hypothetical protein
MFRVLVADDFMQLLTLYIKMYKYINPAITPPVVSIILAEEMKQPNFIAYGYFSESSKLLGFVTGFDSAPKQFFNSGLYSERKVIVGKLVNGLEQYLKQHEYTCWKTEALGHIKSLAPKFGAQVEKIVYKKEL